MFANKKHRLLIVLSLLMLALLVSACQPQQVVSTVVVTKEVEKEVIVTREVVVTQEVEVMVTPEPEKEMTAYERMLATHKVTIGSYNEVPHNYFDPTTGEFSGVDWDIMKYILDKWGVTEINPIVADWSALIPGLQARRWDLISVGMGITDKRKEVINFSDPVFGYGMTFVVPQGNPEESRVHHRICQDTAWAPSWALLLTRLLLRWKVWKLCLTAPTTT